jgi:CheY-like chemotaxis protein
MRGNSGSSMNQYSRPSCSWPRGARVVCETDTAQVRVEFEQRLDQAGLAGPAGRGDDEEVAGGFHHVVDVAHDGIEGRRLATGGDYDLVLLDVMLPGVDGFGVLARRCAQRTARRRC